MTHGTSRLRVTLLSALLLLAACGGSPEPASSDFSSDSSALSATAGVTADAYVDSAHPSTNYGTVGSFQTDTWPSTQRGLMKLTVSGIPSGAQVTSAKLELYVTNASPDPVVVSQAEGTFSESSVTWANAPSVGAQLASFPAPTHVGTWVSVDLVSAIQGNGQYAFYVTTASGDSTVFASRESANKPRLTVTYTEVTGVTEDAYVDSAHPSTNYGAVGSFQTDTWPSTQRGLMKLTVSGIPSGAQVTSAKLELYVTNSSPDPVVVSQAEGTFSESSVTWANAPSVGAQLASFPAPTHVGTWVSVDLVSAIKGNGQYAFYVTTASGDSTVFASRESTNKPRLTVTYVEAPHATVSVTAAAGDGTATLNWTVTPNGDSVDGVLIGRDGTDTGGGGPWESALKPGLSGSGSFTALVNDTEYTLYAQPVVGGVRGAKATIKVTPTRNSNYGGTTGWKVIKTFDLTRDEGWSHTTGNRGIDSSYNRKEQTTFGPDGMLITAERASDTDTIYSSDAKAKFYDVPDIFAVEAEITLGGYLGEGMFPALWLRPTSGQGELDIWEFLGNYVGKSNMWKTTLIKTASTGTYNQGSKEAALPLTKELGTHLWRYEKTHNQVAVWVDGTLLATITKAQFDSAAGSGSWDAQMEAGHGWYMRLTYQVGPPTTGGWNGAGTVPAGWRQSTYLVSRMVVYGK